MQPDTFKKISRGGSIFVDRRRLLVALASGYFTHSEKIISNALASPLFTGDYVTPEMFGAVGGGADDTSALRNALATNSPVHLKTRYRITDSVNLGRQLLFGTSSHTSGLNIDQEFSTSSSAIIHMIGGEPGGEIRDIGLFFFQPNVSDRAALIKYPAAIVARIPRFKLARLRIERAMVAIDMRGNAGGATLDDIELSAFEKAIWIDGALDSVKINNLHIWPFGMVDRQRKIFSDVQNIGLYSGRCDDLHLTNATIYGIPKAALFTRTKRGATFGSLSNVDFDHYGGLHVESGNLRVVGCSFTAGEQAAQWLKLADGDITLGSCWFHSAAELAVPGIEVGARGAITMNGAAFSTRGNDFVHVYCASGGVINASGINIRKHENVHYYNPLFRFDAGARVGLHQTIVTPLGTGSGVLIDAKPGASGLISDVQAPGWRNRIANLKGRDVDLGPTE